MGFIDPGGKGEDVEARISVGNGNFVAASGKTLCPSSQKYQGIMANHRCKGIRWYTLVL